MYIYIPNYRRQQPLKGIKILGEVDIGGVTDTAEWRKLNVRMCLQREAQ